MKVNQIYEIMNSISKEVLGKEGVLQEDLSNVVDFGNEIFNATNVDNYVKTLVDHIGKVVFVNRVYKGNVPSVLMDAWEFGSVIEKISSELPEATENESWELVDGASYDPNIFYKPKVSAKFFNSKVTFEIPRSITERQVKESFSSAEQLNGLLSMLFNDVEKSLTVKMDSLIMRTINNMIAETIYDEYKGAALNSKSGVRAVNLLKIFNDTNPYDNLTFPECLTDMNFIKFAAYTMSLYEKRLSRISTLFNIGGKERFTPSELLHVVLLSDFSEAANVYLQAQTFHDEFTKLPNAEIVPYWQGSGLDYSVSSTSKINIAHDGHNVETSGILGVMFDRDALGVANLNKRTTTQYNAKAEFTNYWFKFDAGYFNDLNENFVVFFAA